MDLDLRMCKIILLFKKLLDAGLQSILPEKRNCYFPHEAQYMKLHLNYSQSNCLLECSLEFAQETLSNKTGDIACTPWYFPFIDENHKICDPWETEQLSQIMAKQVLQTDIEKSVFESNIDKF